jgi:C1A family cysteine protease
MPRFIPPALGWHRDIPDPRDYILSSRPVREMLQKLKRSGNGRHREPKQVDWRAYCSAVGDQQDLQSCTAHACLGLTEYFERRAHGKSLDGSRLFLYKMARQLQQRSGDQGASLRATLKAMVRFGTPPAHYWPYDTTEFDKEPASFLYSFARDFHSIRYLRLDPPNSTGAEILDNMKSFLAAGLASMFGFSLISSISQAADIPAPTMFDSVRGGHAVVTVGYDDHHKIRSTKGAFLICNSWGSDWGDDGYGWLPYVYIQERLAVDVWTLLKPDWIESAEFEQPLQPARL